ncbi:MAG: ABC transporter ATP-binding protein [Lachnospiraceae bacterium]|nr:ABC transporter ATP-binding protein [Lachnospiraceae bacterium]
MIKKLSSCIGEYKKESLLAPIFVTLEVIMEVLIPIFMAFLVDNGIEKGDMDYIIKIGVALLTASLLALIFGTLSGYFAANASAGFAKNIRRSLYYKVQNFSFYNIDTFSTASLVTRLTTDVNYIQMAYQMIIRIAVRSPVMLVFSLIAAFSLNHRASLIFVAVVPFLMLSLFMITKTVHPLFERIFKTYDKLNTIVQENLRGIRVVKSFVREEYEKEKFNAVSETIYKDFSKAEKILAFLSPVMQFSIYTIILFFSWFGAKLIVAESMTTGELMSLIAYAMQILMSLMMFSMVFVIITISRASAKRITEVFDAESDIKNPENPITEVKDGSIEFENVNFSYSKDINKLCLKNINLSIKSGETIGIIGGTGSSKSSLIQLIPRLYDVTCGSLKVGGADVRDYDLKALRDSVSVVLQKNVLFSGTIKDNLRWGNKDATDEELKNACHLAKADEFIDSFPEGYDTYIEQGGSNISGGQKQRLCIARALLKRPKILILDDSTSAVDTKTDALIRRSFVEEIPGTTKIIIAQRAASVMDSDKIIVMDDGKINAAGTHSELLASSNIYREVYYSQVKEEEK